MNEKNIGFSLDLDAFTFASAFTMATSAHSGKSQAIG